VSSLCASLVVWGFGVFRHPLKDSIGRRKAGRQTMDSEDEIE
jgi:hypothetical protein